MWDDFDEEEEDWEDDEEFNPHREQDRIYKHPLMKKAKDILGLTRALVGSLDEPRKELYGHSMLNDAKQLQIKFSSAESGTQYSLKMESAVLIKVHAKSLFTITYELEVQETHAREHLALLRQAIEDFRKLFLKWIEEMDRDQNFDDGWGIFID